MTDRLSALQHILRGIGLELTDSKLDQLDRFRSLLIEANRHLNLTRITDPADVEIRHFGDALVLLPLLPEGCDSLIDVGTGAGFPGLPLAVARPDIRVTLLEATGKKVRFLNDTIEALGLTNVTALHGRAEELARDAAHRERYGAVTARAVAALAALVELTLPFVQVGGVGLYPKGGRADSELADARHAIRMLGGDAASLHPMPIEGTIVVRVEKVMSTSSAYPRRSGIPQQHPLRPGLPVKR